MPLAAAAVAQSTVTCCGIASESETAKTAFVDPVLPSVTSAAFATETGYRAPQSEFIDAVVFDGRKPNAYLDQFAIGLKGDKTL